MPVLWLKNSLREDIDLARKPCKTVYGYMQNAQFKHFVNSMNWHEDLQEYLTALNLAAHEAQLIVHERAEDWEATRV